MRRSLPAAILCSAFLSLPAAAQEASVESGGEETITISGFISGSMFLQDDRFGFTNGHAAEWAAVEEFADDEWFLGGDVRNTRLTLGFSGPEVFRGWRAGGVLELDFFGGFSNPGPFGDEQPNPRLRLAYADLTDGRTTLRIGQFWSPIFGYVPASLSHLAFPLGYGSAGMIGWRFPGVGLYHRLTGPDAPVRAQLQLVAQRGSWVATRAELIADNLSPGEASAIPQLEARLDLGGTLGGTPWGAYVVGHFDRKDLSGPGEELAAAEVDELTGTALEVGARLTPGPLTLQGNAYRGSSIGQQLGHITQFGDISGWGAWGQVGYALSPRWSVWGFYGVADPDDEDVREAVLTPLTPLVERRDARLRNRQVDLMLRFGTGQYALALEWLRAETEWASRFRTAALPDVREQFERDAHQIALSVFYAF